MVAIVTGGSSGIGLAVARRLGANGDPVLLVARGVKRLADVKAELRSEGLEVSSLAADISAPASAAEIRRRCVELYSGVDVLVNSAGVFEVGDFLRLSRDRWDQTMNTNLTGTAFLAKECAMVMPPGGRIVNIASINGLISEPMSVAYSASKAAVMSLTRSLAVDLAPRGIMVNCVAPGWVRTPMIEEYLKTLHPAFVARLNPLGRLGEPAEIAEVVAFLSRSDVTYLTGQTVMVDGGQTSMAVFPVAGEAGPLPEHDGQQ